MAAGFCWALAAAEAQQSNDSSGLTHLELEGVEITKAELHAAGTTVPPPYPEASSSGTLPAHSRVDGVIRHRKSVGGEEFGIGFALALPEREAWNGDFLTQGGGGGNGFVAVPQAAAKV